MKKTLLFFSTIVMLSSCYREDDYLLSNLDDSFVKLSIESETLDADGMSSTGIFIEIPYGSKKEINKVLLRTSKGKFENDKQEIEATLLNMVINGQNKKMAKAKLTSSQRVEHTTIEAKIGDIVKYADVEFIRAYPEKIKTDLPSLTIKYGYQTINLTTKLTRTIGKPSIMTNAKIYAIDPQGNVIGQFLNYDENVNENGILINQYSLGESLCKCQNIFIVSETKSSQSTVIRDTTKLIIIM
jgi:hypothetical protein